MVIPGSEGFSRQIAKDLIVDNFGRVQIFNGYDDAKLTTFTPATQTFTDTIVPNWDMGRKISVDSASMMNKGLEVIEARWLFDATPEQIQVVVHPQSVIHSMVEYADGSVLAQLGNPDMRTPIAHALAWPERHASGVASLNLFDIARLDFEAPDVQRFPCLRLAFEAVSAGGIAPAVLNAANEIAVERFLQGGIRFTAIPQIIERTLEQVTEGDEKSLDGLMAADAAARVVAEQQAATAV